MWRGKLLKPWILCSWKHDGPLPHPWLGFPVFKPNLTEPVIKITITHKQKNKRKNLLFQVFFPSVRNGQEEKFERERIVARIQRVLSILLS